MRSTWLIWDCYLFFRRDGISDEDDGIGSAASRGFLLCFSSFPVSKGGWRTDTRFGEGRNGLNE
jgi:hypothetical protein